MPPGSSDLFLAFQAHPHRNKQLVLALPRGIRPWRASGSCSVARPWEGKA